MELDRRPDVAEGSKKRSRSRSNSPSRSRLSAGSEDEDESSASSDAWSDLDDDNWLNQPDADAQAARLAARGSRTSRYTRAVTPEKIDSKTPLKEDNVGMKMLKLMGWNPGGGLGALGNGRAEPIPLPEMMNGLGLGKANIETRMLAEVINQGPRILESQKIATETDEQKAAREAKIATKAVVSAAVQETLSKFHCDICNKGYANVAQWEEHLLSYGHNHAKRKKEVAMQSRSNKNTADEVNKRREKEKKREQKELERMMKAVGGSSASATQQTVGAGLSSSSVAPLSAAPKMPMAPPSIGEKKKGGFFKVATSSQPPPPPPSSLSGSAYGAPPPPPPSAAPPPPPPPSDAYGAAPPPPPPSVPSSWEQSPSLGDRARTAPRFTSSASSSLAATWKGPPTIAPVIKVVGGQSSQSTGASTSSQYASTWKPMTAPALHPLLAGASSHGASSHTSSGNPVPPGAAAGGWQNGGSKWKSKAKEDRNDFFKRDEAPASSPYEMPTAASTINTARAPKSMTFVSSSVKPPGSNAPNALGCRAGSMSLAGNAAQKRRPLDMNADDDEDDESGMPLPTGRPKAGMPPSSGPGGFKGFRPLGK